VTDEADGGGERADSPGTRSVRIRFGLETYVVSVEWRPLETVDGLVDRARRKVREEHDPAGSFTSGSPVEDDRT
jgi:hypothetical protein